MLINNKVIKKYSTVGDGNCFFHAVFGKKDNFGQYRAERAPAMRKEFTGF
ncbi:OTU domain-containing protein [Wolbachia endosymbiont of Ctenocephalides felis wCfeT]|nr:hypothetical protein [Wolbachia endosymbiont of Ctenocephalides felis wCfeT]